MNGLRRPNSLKPLVIGNCLLFLPILTTHLSVAIVSRMKILLNSSRAYYFYQRTQIQLFSTRTHFPQHKSTCSDYLYSRILRLGDPNLSMVPVLDQWVGEKRSFNTWKIQKVINTLTMYGRFKHALEVSLWMTNKTGHLITPFDIAVRLKLVYKMLGLEQAENHFNKIPESMRTYHVYLALLNCYTMARSLDKAELTLQKARDLGFVRKAVWYNLMMKLHYQLGDEKKLSDLLGEMDSDGILPDQFTLSVCLQACAKTSNIVEMDKIVKIVDSDPTLHVGWRTFVIAAEGYIKLGLVDKALVILNKLEDKLNIPENRGILYVFVIRLYAEAGQKEAVYRIWNQLKQRGKVYNKSYTSMLRGLHTLGDIKGMEMILDEWDLSGLSFDFHVPNLLVNAYCSEGRLEEAEALINREISRGGNPLVVTWCHLAGAYLGKNQVREAVEALKKAISLCPTSKPTTRDSLMTCLEYLGRGDNTEKAEEILKLLRTRGAWREAGSDDTCDFIKDLESQGCEKNQDSEGISEVEDELVNEKRSTELTVA